MKKYEFFDNLNFLWYFYGKTYLLKNIRKFDFNSFFFEILKK